MSRQRSTKMTFHSNSYISYFFVVAMLSLELRVLYWSHQTSIKVDGAPSVSCTLQCFSVVYHSPFVCHPYGHISNWYVYFRVSLSTYTIQFYNDVLILYIGNLYISLSLVYSPSFPRTAYYFDMCHGLSASMLNCFCTNECNE